MNTVIDGLDLAEIGIIDTHVHPMRITTPTADLQKSAEMYAGLQFPGTDADSLELRARRSRAIFDQLAAYPRQIGYASYMARVHGVPATLDGMDAVVSRHTGSDADLREHVAEVMHREKVDWVVLQAGAPDGQRSGSPALTAPENLYPAGRSVWTWPFESLLDTSWTLSLGATSLADVTALIDESMATAATNGCRGFKNGSAYRRSYQLSRVRPEEADLALRELLASEGTTGSSDRKVLARKTYEDYLFKHIYLTAGKLDVPIVMHMAVAQHPLLRSEFNDASALFDVFHDEDILKAGTRFVIRNTGYPSHYIVSSLISQFPNVYTDTAYFSQYPGVLEEAYRVLLALGPSEKIMHGSDVFALPEGIGYCAWNTRHVLAQVLRDYRTHYGWRIADVEDMANNILHANASRVYGIPAR